MFPAVSLFSKKIWQRLCQLSHYQKHVDHRFTPTHESPALHRDLSSLPALLFHIRCLLLHCMNFTAWRERERELKTYNAVYNMRTKNILLPFASTFYCLFFLRNGRQFYPALLFFPCYSSSHTLHAWITLEN